MGGAIGVRICGIENIRAVRSAVSIPVIGLTKAAYGTGEVLITPTLDDCARILDAGATVIALDATRRMRPSGRTGPELVAEARASLGAPVMADISLFEEGVDAIRSGADFVGTTLSGYTEATRAVAADEPDFGLVRRLATHFPHRVIAEGRIWSPEQAERMMALGAHAVVVGTAITRPVEIVRRYVRWIT
jgi:N-acylglucosamine-6-phosphate 2-epimerase